MPDDNLRFVVDEVSKKEEHGLVLSGEVESGVLRKGMAVFIEIIGEEYKVLKIKGQKEESMDEASAGQQVGVILDGLNNVRVKNGWVLSGVAQKGD